MYNSPKKPAVRRISQFGLRIILRKKNEPINIYSCSNVGQLKNCQVSHLHAYIYKFKKFYEIKRSYYKIVLTLIVIIVVRNKNWLSFLKLASSKERLPFA
jgi:hypothetical protein